jgi:hypothetical protein
MLVEGKLMGNLLIWKSFLLPYLTAIQNSKFCLAANTTFAKNLEHRYYSAKQ